MARSTEWTELSPPPRPFTQCGHYEAGPSAPPAGVPSAATSGSTSTVRSRSAVDPQVAQGLEQQTQGLALRDLARADAPVVLHVHLSRQDARLAGLHMPSVQEAGSLRPAAARIEDVLVGPHVTVAHCGRTRR